MFYLLLRDNALRNKLVKGLKARGISAPFHYIPLHSAPAGLRLGRTVGDMAVTDRVSGTLIRLPMWPGVLDDVETVVAAIVEVLAEE